MMQHDVAQNMKANTSFITDFISMQNTRWHFGEQKGRQLLRVCYLGPAEESSWTEEPPVLLLVATGGEPLPAVLTHHPPLHPFHWHKKILLAAVFRIHDILVWIRILRSVPLIQIGLRILLFWSLTFNMANGGDVPDSIPLLLFDQ
jgi:hypothetical protein